MADGAVLLATFGTTRLYVITRAEYVTCDDAVLDQAARDLADVIGGEDTRGDPGVRYQRIPPKERVWNMDRGNERHTRLGDELWIAEALEAYRSMILDLLAGRIERLRATRMSSSHRGVRRD